MNNYYAKNFSDLNNPSSVSGPGSFAEYILSDYLQPRISLGSTVLIKDLREAEIVWLSGKVVDLKALSPFRADRDIMLYNHSDGDNHSQELLNQVHGPNDEQKIIAKVKIEIELEKNSSGNYVISPTLRPATNSSLMTNLSMEPSDPEMPSLSDVLVLKKTGVNI